MRAIDIHVHVPEPPGDAGAEERQRMAGYFKTNLLPQTPDDMYEKYHSLDLMAVILAIDAETRSGNRYVGNDYVAGVVEKYPDQFIGFASVDPWKGGTAVKELERAINGLGLRGLKLHPTSQAFFPNDERFYPLWRKCSDLGVPVVFHTGQTGVGAGTPGGAGLKLKYAQPLLIDDVAADFPDLTIIMAHPAVPWQEEQLSIALHKAISALLLLTINVGGLIMGPWLVGALNDILGQKMVGYSLAIAVGLGSIASASLFRATYRPYRADYDLMHKGEQGKGH